MGICEVCGNEYDKTFSVLMNGHQFVFDSFECAITALAPICGHCNSRVIGHGVESKGVIYCSAHCSRMEGLEGGRDRIDDIRIYRSQVV